MPIKLDYVKKRETDRSTLYSFNGPFQLMQADIANLENKRNMQQTMMLQGDNEFQQVKIKNLNYK